MHPVQGVKILRVFLCAVFLALCPSLLYADIYEWKDDAGVSHFTDQYQLIPEKYRNSRRRAVKERKVPQEAGPQKSVGPAQTPAAKARSIPDPGSEGALLYARKCAKCHTLQDPGRYSQDKWGRVLVEMEAEMERKKMAPLTPYERSTILEYLRDHAR